MSWKVKGFEDNHIQCSLCKSPTIYLEPMPRSKIELLMESYPHQEWFAYLVGRESKENFCIEDISVPPHHHANSGSAEADKPDFDKELGKYKFHQPKNCLGVIHSHHSMGAFHSGTDHDYVDQNFPISIVVAKTNNTLGYNAVSFAITPCGKATVGDGIIKYVQPKPLFDAKTFLKKAKENIDKGKQVVALQKPFRKDPPYIPIRYRLSEDIGGKEDIIYFTDVNNNYYGCRDRNTQYE